MNRSIFIILSFVLFGCTSRKQIILPSPVLSMTELTDFCDLPNHKNEEVYVRGIYSGMAEYWSVSSFERKCKELGPSVDLDIPEDVYVNLSKLQRKKLRDVHNKYWNRYLIVDMIGTYDDSSPNGYGHLGHNKASFTVKRIVDMQIVLKKQ